MKFTDGFWVVKPGVQLFHCVQVQDARWEGDSFVVYCSHVPVTNRGMTLNAPLLTLSFRAPRSGILALKVEHFQGGAGIEPELFYFGLLTGATLGGNLTPIGASANIAAIGILRKNGETVRTRDFLRIGVPFTLAAVLVGAGSLWLFWGI